MKPRMVEVRKSWLKEAAKELRKSTAVLRGISLNPALNNWYYTCLLCGGRGETKKYASTIVHTPECLISRLEQALGAGEDGE